jgi:hypothetical protein
MSNQKKAGYASLTVLVLGVISGSGWLGYRYWMKYKSNSNSKKDNSCNIVACQKQSSQQDEPRECSHVSSSESEHHPASAESQACPDPVTNLTKLLTTRTRLPCKQTLLPNHTSTTDEVSDNQLNISDQIQEESPQWNTHVSQLIHPQEMSPLAHVVHVQPSIQDQRGAIRGQGIIPPTMQSVVFPTIPELNQNSIGTNASNVEPIETHQSKNYTILDSPESESVSVPSFESIDQHPTMMIAYNNEARILCKISN